MAKTRAGEVAIVEADCQAQCPALINEVAQGPQCREVALKRQALVATTAPFPTSAPELWGALKGTVKVAPGVDLTKGTGEWAS